ncbi:hypothetical protein [Caballeronia telluris]|nr:hypothetical protein [Caballeronia telluris]
MSIPGIRNGLTWSQVAASVSTVFLLSACSLDAEGNERKQDNNFTVNGTQSLSSVQIGVRTHDAMSAENERRFSGYDRRLLRPETMPKLVGFALRFMSAGKSK